MFAAASLLFVLCLFSYAYPQPAQISEQNGKTLIIENAPEMNVIAFGKTVIVRSNAKEVFSWGGDVIVEGRVEGDVAVLGGSVIQREAGYIGGAVIVIGGAYKPDTVKPLRADAAETIVFGMFEEEFRNLAENPAEIFAPAFSAAFVIQRILSALFWFLVSLVFATLAPGAVSRAIAQFQTNPLRTTAIGSAVLVLSLALAIVGLSLLPDYMGAVVSVMALVLLFLAYVFGRVVLQVKLGRWAARRFFGGIKLPDSAAIFIGTVAWTFLLSLPYVWPFAVFALFAAGTGLILTASRRSGWKTVNGT